LDINAALSIINTLLVLATAILAFISIRKFRQSRGIDFILNAESAIDPIRQGLLGSDPALIRNIYRNFCIENLSDEDCQAFPFMHAVYVHVSRSTSFFPREIWITALMTRSAGRRSSLGPGTWFFQGLSSDASGAPSDAT
jgi:hypothetical protein